MTLSSPEIMHLIFEEYGDDLSCVFDCQEGICFNCGNIQGEVEPDARGYMCEACGEYEVHGIEDAIIVHGV